MKNCPVRRLIQLKQGYHHGDLRNAVVNEALKLLEQEGHSDFALRDLARRVGVSAAALYAHFADKSALRAAIATAGFIQLRQAIEATIGEAGDLMDRFLQMGWAYVRFGVERPALYKLMFASEDLPAKRAQYPELEAAAEAAFSLVTDMLEHMQRRGVVRPGNLEAYGLSVWAHVHGLTSLIITGRVECACEPAPAPAELVAASLMTLVSGLRTPARAEQIA